MTSAVFTISYRKLFLIWSLTIFQYMLVQSQSLVVPDGTFRSPVDYTFRLSGGFNELRETHFHSGIDIKPSSGAKKDKIYCIGAGFVSRIKVAAGGYGYALYIDHPECGFTSVYAHLESYSSRIDKIVKSYQLKQESFEVDIYLTSDILPVTTGEVIGIMGTSGFSFGEHLHFEIRDTKTEKPINPYLFGFIVPDKITPTVQNLSIHGLDKNFHKIYDIKVPLGEAENGQISVIETIEVPSSNIGFALQMYDRADGSSNKLGIYGLHVYADEALIYSYHMDKISFSQTRQIIGFFDYQEKKSSGKTYTLCYKYPGNDLDFLAKNGSGLIYLDSLARTKIRIEVEDFFRNRKTIHFEVKGLGQQNDSVPDKKDFKQWVYEGQKTEITESGIQVTFGKNSLFRNIAFRMKTKNESGRNTSYKIHESNEPVKSDIDLRIRPDMSDTKWKDKTIMTYISSSGKMYNCGGSWQDGYIKCRINEFGTYRIDYDTVAPTIKNINFKTKAGKISRYKFEIKDNLPVKGKDVNEISHKVWINGAFVIAPFSLKSSILEIPIADLPAGTHELRIEVRDHSRNTAYYKATFIKI